MAQKIQKVAVCPCLSAFSCWPCASSPPRGVALFGIPQLAALAFLDLFVLLTRVTLARHLHEVPVYHGALMHDQVVLVQKGVKFIEQLLEKTFLCQFLLESPYRFLVGHLVAAGQSEEVAERQSVANLVFHLRVTEMVYPL